MRFLAPFLLLLGSCSILAPIIGGAAGAAGGSILGPAGAATGAAGGVMLGQLTFPYDNGPFIPGTSEVISPGGTASTIHEASNFVETVGEWYLLIFIIVPFLSRRFRGWAKNKVIPANLFAKKTNT